MVSAPTKPEAVSTTPAPVWEGDPLVIRFPPGVLSDELFVEICNLNDDWQLERNALGGLEMSPPAGFESSDQSGRIYAQILAWSDSTGGGRVFESSAGVLRSDGVVRSPDASWVSKPRLAEAFKSESVFLAACPDLVVEVRSRGQTVAKQQEKMVEWMLAGARLGWLIDPFTADGEVWIYREGSDDPERQSRPLTLSGENVAEGLSVDLAKVWR